MKKLAAALLLAALPGLTLADVPTHAQLQQGNFHLYVDQLTGPPIFDLPGGTPPGGQWGYWFIVSVWDEVDLPLVAFRVTVQYTSSTRKGSISQILTRFSVPGSASIPVNGKFYLAPDAIITSVLVEGLEPVTAESF